NHTINVHTISLHDAIPISLSATTNRVALVRPLKSGVTPPQGYGSSSPASAPPRAGPSAAPSPGGAGAPTGSNTAMFSLVSTNTRSEEHTSELQSRENLVCR